MGQWPQQLLLNYVKIVLPCHMRQTTSRRSDMPCRLVLSSLFVYCNNSSTPQFASKPGLSMHILHIHCAIVFSLLLARTGHSQARDNGKFQLYTSLWLWRPLIDILVADTSQDTMEFYIIANICWHIILSSWPSIPTCVYESCVLQFKCCALEVWSLNYLADSGSVAPKITEFQWNSSTF